MNFLKITINILEKGIAWTAGSLIIMSSLLCFTDAIARTFFKKGVFFFPTLEVLGIIWTSFLMVGMVLEAREHVSVDFILSKQVGTTQKFLNILNSIATVAFCLLATWAGIVYVGFLRKMHTTRELMIVVPYWIICIIIPIGMGVATLYSIGMLVMYFWGHFYKKQEG